MSEAVEVADLAVKNYVHEAQESFNKLIMVKYTNWRGETSLRKILPIRIWYGATEWHPQSQWFMDAYDTDKEALRSFALKDIEKIS